jgi:predicted O-linked N-acetylglucosamine transferase (SPINDLY family)
MNSHGNLLGDAQSLQKSGRFAEALAAFEKYLRLAPHDIAGLQGLAESARLAGHGQRARAAAESMLAIRPEDPGTLLLVGNILEDLGDLDGAVDLLRKAVRINPSFAQGHNNLGIVLRSRGLLEEAIACFRAAVNAKPDYTRAWNNLGSLLLQAGREEEALKCFERSVEIEPNYPHGHLRIGLYHLAKRRFTEAEASLRHAAELDPRLAEAQLALGSLHRERNDLEAAEQALRRSLELNPQRVEALVGLGEVLGATGDRPRALECFRRATVLQPNNLRAHLGLALTLPQVYASTQEVEACRAAYAEGLDRLLSGASRFIAALGPVDRRRDVEWKNFHLAYQGRDDRVLQVKFARFQRAMLEPELPELYRPIAPRRRAGRRIRVGFVSAFYYRCTAGNYFKSWITQLDRNRFESVVYSLCSWPDDLTQEVRVAADAFREAAPFFVPLAQQLRGEELDVLIYPELGMHPRVFTQASLRLAPLQCAGWGHPVTTGHDNIDVFFSSEAMEPPGAEHHYSERLVKLPGLGTSYARPTVPSAGRRADFGLPEDATLYLFPQSLFKIHPDNDDLLVEILAREPRAVIVMFQSRYAKITQRFIARLSGRFKSRGLATSGRIKLLPELPHADYLRVNLSCDVMLDSLYWSGGNTSLDAIACSLPIVTCPGDLMRGRQSAGMLSAMGLDELVVSSREAYVELALRVGSDPQYRDTLRHALARRSALIFDQEAPIRALEAFLLSAVPE